MTALRYIDVCSGLSAPTLAWKPLGWQPLCYSEIEAAPRAVLKHHYPDTPLHGDFTKLRGDKHGPADLLVGGTPCQDYSIAGLRAGLDGGRGNLTLEFSRLAYRSRTRWLVWENVPGVLSTNDGRDFGAILATFSGRHGLVFAPPRGGWQNSGIVEPADNRSFGLAWRVLDAQFFGVAQRRRRVFLVGYLGDWRRAAAVLLERAGLSGHPPPRREAGQRSARSLRAQSQSSHREDSDTFVTTFDRQSSGEYGTATVASTVSARDYKGASDIVAHSLMAIQERAVCENPDAGPDGAGFRADGQAYTLEARSVPQAVAFDLRNGTQDETAMSVQAGGMGDERGLCPNATPHTLAGSAVRRLTPRECERLQGIPDDFTLVPYRKGLMADGPRYKMIGNSWAVPCGRWLGERIDFVERLG